MGNIKQNSVRCYSKSFKVAGNVPAVDEESKLENLCSKVDKLGEFWKTGKADENLAR